MATNIAGILREAQVIAMGAEFILGHAGQIMRFEPMIVQAETVLQQLQQTGETTADIKGIVLGGEEWEVDITLRRKTVTAVPTLPPSH